MSIAEEHQFSEWKERAIAVGLLATAQMFGAKLRKAGAEYIGPCCNCGGTDRLAIHVTKNKWHCRGHGGGESPITLAMHIGSLSWKEAAERLAGPCPSGPAKPLSEAELAERNRRRVENERAQQARKAEEAQYQEDTREAAAGIIRGSVSIEGTIAEQYLNSRGIPTPAEGWPNCLRFHGALPYPKKSGTYATLVCRVDDMAGELCAVWRIYLRGDGRKADVPAAKLGLGPAGGGAVRIGGVAASIAIAEGVETALAYWTLTDRKQPCWASLSTSGMVSVEVPLIVEYVDIVPDGDAAIKRDGYSYSLIDIPPGRRAANTLLGRLNSCGVTAIIQPEPAEGFDYLDVLSRLTRMESAW